MSNNFTIRVYGLILNESTEILLSDEFRFNQLMTKFPGGGLEYGEGVVDCLKREIKEELNTHIHTFEHFYTTDYFQQAMFVEDLQLISIYYLCQLEDYNTFKMHKNVEDLKHTEGNQTFRWMKLKNIREDEITFPIDKKVVKMLKEKYL